jgi:hypothetical protein
MPKSCGDLPRLLNNRLRALILLNAFFGASIAEITRADVPISKAIVVSCRTNNAEDFEKLAELAKEIGATDVDVSDLPKDRWQWFDPADPYPNWSMRMAGVLKVMVPAELLPAVPNANALICQKILTERGDILRKHGLKAFFQGCEPMWLPEAIYQEHPHWRGPTCQAPERSRHNYYAPNIDDAEVLALYRKATAGLCRLVPVEEFDFLAGDSGSGIAWDPDLYTGANGPIDTKDRPLVDRVNGFMEAISSGAKDAGVNTSLVIKKYSLLAPGRPSKTVTAGDSDYVWSSKVFPVPGIADPVQFAAELENVFAHPEDEWKIGVPSLEFTTSFDLIRVLRKSAVKGPLQRMMALNTVASKLVGEAKASELVEAWQQVHDAILILEQIDNGGPILLLGSVNQRWLVRPLVPYPLALTAAEKDYYRRFQFQGNTEENAANLMNVQGLYAISGDAGTNLANDLFQHTIDHLKAAHSALQNLLEENPKLDEIKALDLRIQALILVVKNADLTARYQCYLDKFAPDWKSHSDHHGFPTVQEGKNLVALDEANTRELINLINSTSTQLIFVAPTEAEEDVFQYGPELVSQLEKKIQIEEAHLPDLYRL